jgi:hypothetical protein
MHFPLQKSFSYRGSFPRHDRARVVHQSTPSKTSGGRREGRARAAPAAPVRKKSTGKEPQVKAGHPAFPARWCYGLYALSPGTGLVCPRRAPAAHGASRVLGASVGAPGPHDFTVRKRLGRRAQRLRQKLSRPSHPASRFLTTAKRPSCRSGTGEISHISEKRKRRIFFAAGLDTGINVESAREIRSVAHAIFARGRPIAAAITDGICMTGKSAIPVPNSDGQTSAACSASGDLCAE